MKNCFLSILFLTASYAAAQKTSVFFMPRIGHDFIVSTGKSTFVRGGRYIYEKSDQNITPLPSNWYVGIGLETYNAGIPLRFAFDALLTDRTIDRQVSGNSNTFTARALKGKVLVKYVFGDVESSHHFFLGGGTAYTTNLNEKYYENGILKNNFLQKLTSSGATAIVGMGYEWQPTSSSVTSNDAVIEIGIYYNQDLFPFIKAYSDTKLSYINIGINLKGIFSLLLKNPNG